MIYRVGGPLKTPPSDHTETEAPRTSATSRSYVRSLLYSTPANPQMLASLRPCADRRCEITLLAMASPPRSTNRAGLLPPRGEMTIHHAHQPLFGAAIFMKRTAGISVRKLKIGKATGVRIPDRVHFSVNNALVLHDECEGLKKDRENTRMFT